MSALTLDLDLAALVVDHDMVVVVGQPTVIARLEQICRERIPREKIMSKDLAGIELCVFDAYGTLFDFNSAVARHRTAIGPSADALSDLWRSKQIQYTWLRNGMGAYAEFWQVTGEALDHCLAVHGITDPGVRQKLMGAYLALDPFLEVPATLETLRRAGKRLAILSNGNPAMLAPMVEASGLSDRFEAVLSVDEAGVFKPDPRVYRLVEARSGVKPAHVCFLSSNCWDAHGAAHFGFQTVWVNRACAPDDRLPGRLSGEIADLSLLPALLGVS
ncbi:MAG: haloacid dehalogenase type II [Reyranella sp.]|uniref:haloacid dehalogenase type II n=1 Tax=Reyranella sp. TaxID=1929291 RepID=UPI003D0E9ED9